MEEEVPVRSNGDLGVRGDHQPDTGVLADDNSQPEYGR